MKEFSKKLKRLNPSKVFLFLAVFVRRDLPVQEVFLGDVWEKIIGKSDGWFGALSSACVTLGIQSPSENGNGT